MRVAKRSVCSRELIMQHHPVCLVSMFSGSHWESLCSTSEDCTHITTFHVPSVLFCFCTRTKFCIRRHPVSISLLYCRPIYHVQNISPDLHTCNQSYLKPRVCHCLREVSWKSFSNQQEGDCPDCFHLAIKADVRVQFNSKSPDCDSEIIHCTLPFHDHAAGPSEKANAYMPPRVLFHARHKAPCIMHVQCKDAAIAHSRREPDDELKRGNHLTLPKQEYDTSRPAT